MLIRAVSLLGEDHYLLFPDQLIERRSIDPAATAALNALLAAVALMATLVPETPTAVSFNLPAFAPRAATLVCVICAAAFPCATKPPRAQREKCAGSPYRRGAAALAYRLPKPD